MTFAPGKAVAEYNERVAEALKGSHGGRIEAAEGAGSGPLRTPLGRPPTRREGGAGRRQLRLSCTINAPRA